MMGEDKKAPCRIVTIKQGNACTIDDAVRGGALSSTPQVNIAGIEQGGRVVHAAAHVDNRFVLRKFAGETVRV